MTSSDWLRPAKAEGPYRGLNVEMVDSTTIATSNPLYEPAKASQSHTPLPTNIYQLMLMVNDYGYERA